MTVVYPMYCPQPPPPPQRVYYYYHPNGPVNTSPIVAPLNNPDPNLSYYPPPPQDPYIPAQDPSIILQEPQPAVPMENAAQNESKSADKKPEYNVRKI